jgi:hypothetical protein
VENIIMPVDLFNTSASDGHPFYKQLCEPGSVAEKRREQINLIWQWFSDDRLADKNFLSDFPINTIQRWWELETAWFLKNCGFSLSKTKAGSDFICKKESIELEVEAVAPTPGTEGNPDFVPEIMETVNLRERERIELLRLTSVINDKAKKHLSDIIKGHSDPSKPFIIALSPAGLPRMFAGWDMPAALKAVYCIGGQYYSIDPVTGQFLSRQWESRPQIHKKKLAPVPISTQVFCPGCGTDQHRQVSALLYSNMNIWVHGYPYSPTEHQKQFVLLHNEDSSIRLKKGLIKVGTEYWLESTGNTYEFKLVKVES